MDGTWTTYEVWRMVEQQPMRAAFRRYLAPLASLDRVDRRRRLNKLADQIVLRMEHGRGGDTLARATERLVRFEREADALRAEGRQPTRWQDLRRVAAARVYWRFRDRIEKPAGLDGYEWAAIEREKGHGA